MPDSRPTNALTKAIKVAGSQAAVASVCGVSATAVWKWVHVSKKVPAEFVLKIEAAYGVSRHELRPDLYPREDAPAVRGGAGFGEIAA